MTLGVTRFSLFGTARQLSAFKTYTICCLGGIELCFPYFARNPECQSKIIRLRRFLEESLSLFIVDFQLIENSAFWIVNELNYVRFIIKKQEPQRLNKHREQFPFHFACPEYEAFYRGRIASHNNQTTGRPHTSSAPVSILILLCVFSFTILE